MPKEHLIENYRRNIVFLGVRTEASRAAVSVSILGTGMIIDGQYIVTSSEIGNNLVASLAASSQCGAFAGLLDRVEEGTDIYQTSDIRFVDQDDVRGIAVFEFPKKLQVGFSMSDLETDEDCLKAGVEALALGFLRQDQWLQRDPKPCTEACKVSSVEKIDDRVQFLRLDSDLTALFSGSALIDIGSARVIGVLVGSFESFTSTGAQVSVALASSEIYDVLDCISATLPVEEDFFDECDILDERV